MLEEKYPHRRLNPLTGDWVLVSPQRTQRPWIGQVEEAPQANQTPYDPNCYLCPGNLRAGGQGNPNYPSTFVFDNDYSALLSVDQLKTLPSKERGELHWGKGIEKKLADRFFVLDQEHGICRVVCFSPRHDLTLPDLTVDQIEAVVHTWIKQTHELELRDYIRYVQIFENKGSMMGASNPHPHCQIWATSIIPNEPTKELTSQSDHFNQYGSCLLCDYLKIERIAEQRIVVENDHFTALVPFWAVWPFEVILLANRHLASLTDLEANEAASLADILKRLTTRYDNLFEISFPYSMGFHPSPSDGKDHPEWHFHAHYYPPLLRSATVRKFMVGFEMLASPQRDLTPEGAAEQLRSVSEVHYHS
jgi:UDPglucose--hexose-1-phosphate uridylyltransferase